MTYSTEQEQFWAGEFGEGYIERNSDESVFVSNVALFRDILRHTAGVSSVVELGCNIGLNLRALKFISPSMHLVGYEINEQAAALAAASNVGEIRQETILNDLTSGGKYDLAFTKGVLIHINPEELSKVYENLHVLSQRYIVVCEYYNPSPVKVAYRGNSDRLFKRDFAGDLLDKYDLKLLDYGFTYHRDNLFPQDDVTWFLLEKNS